MTGAPPRDPRISFATHDQTDDGPHVIPAHVAPAFDAIGSRIGDKELSHLTVVLHHQPKGVIGVIRGPDDRADYRRPFPVFTCGGDPNAQGIAAREEKGCP